MLFVDIGDNTIVNLKFIQAIEFNEERTEAKVYWFSGESQIYTGTKAIQLIKKVLAKLPENWGKQ